MVRNFLRLTPLVAVAVLLPNVSLGAQLQVCHNGCAYSTIQSAVSAAASGDTISVSQGLFSERVTIQGKTLNIEGSPGTIVQGVGVGGPVFTLGAGSGPYYEVDLSYLTVMGGDHNTSSQVGGGIQVRIGAYLHLSNVSVIDNYAGAGGGIGVMTSGGPPTTLSQCSIMNNQGSGIYVGAGASVTIEQCSVANNTDSYGGGIYTEAGSTLTIDGTAVSNNQALGTHSHDGPGPGLGGGLYVLGNLAMTNSTVSGNVATDANGRGIGGGIFVVLGGSVSIQGSVISQNSIPGSGSGVGIFASSNNPAATLTLTNDYIVLNTVPFVATIGGPNAGGVANQGTLILSGTTIANNSSPDCAGGTGCPK